jgi:hypothetical protein
MRGSCEYVVEVGGSWCSSTVALLVGVLNRDL